MNRPSWHTELRARLTGLALTPVREADIVEELSSHLDERYRELCLEHEDAEAREIALSELDGSGVLAARLRTLRLARAKSREASELGTVPRRLLTGLAADLRHGFRALGTHPGFAATVIVTLALGIGANTAIFSVIDSVLLRATPFVGMDRLLMIWETDRDSGTVREPASFPDFLDFSERSQLVESAAAFMGEDVTAATTDGLPLRLHALAVTHGFLPLLGIQPILGRTFNAQEDRPGGARVALISAGLWERLYGRDAAVIGRTLRLDDVATTIIGVLPDGSDLGALQVLSAAAYSRAFADRGTHTTVDLWIPRQWDARSVPRSTHPIFVIGRLATGATMATAQDELSNIAADLEKTYPVNDARGVFVEPLDQVIFGPVRPTLVLLAGAVALVLLVACANVATLLLARGASRMREAAVRRAIGASGWHLTRQFLAESLVLTLVSTVVGVGVAAAGLRLLVGMAPANVPRLADVALNFRVLGLAVGVAVAVGIVFAFIPVSQARRVDLQSACKGLAPSSTGWTRKRASGKALVVCQVALAALLVVGTGLLLRSFWTVLEVDAGFHTGGVLKAEYQLPASRYPNAIQIFPNFTEAHAANQELLTRVDAVPGVTSVALAGNHPLDAGFTNSFVVVGRESEASDWPEISVRRVSPGYFDTVRLDVTAGRPFRDSDDTAAPRVALINQSAADRFFAVGDPLSQQLGFWGFEWRIVGIVADERSHGLEQAAPLALYLPLSQAPSTTGVYTLLARTTDSPETVTPAARHILRDIDPGLALFGVEPLDQTLSRSVGQRRFIVTLLALFAGLAVLLAVTGVQGLLSHDVARRTREIGIRIALGARPAAVAGDVVREGTMLAVLGLAIGCAVAIGASRVLSGWLFGVSPVDPVVFIIVPVTVLVCAAAASYLPARRAARVDPLLSLKVE